MLFKFWKCQHSWEGAKKMYAEAMDEGKASIIKRKDGRPSLNSSHQAEGLTTRPNFEPYIKESCIICHIPDGSASKVEFEAAGTLMR